MNNTSMVSKDRLEFDPIIPEDERRFYQKAYPNVNFVRERKVHCTVCKMHIGTAPSNESIIRMHPILRVTHCKKCHDFYNSGEFSKGEDGSELYCRWCGQGGEVYCCSNCPFVFCKSCIISNLSRGVVADIEQNENWSCFNCAPKMLWPLRAQHWALIKFIDKQKKAILNSNLSDAEIKTQMTKDRSLCCKIKKTTGYGSDTSDSSDISLSRLKQKAGEKRSRKSMSKDDLSGTASPALPKKMKNNDEVVCTPDVMSMLEPECQLTVPPSAKVNSQPAASSPKIMSIPQPPKRISPPPLVVRTAQIPQVRPQAPSPIIKKTIVGPRLPTATGGDFNTPVYHTINGYRIDLNSAAQQETVRLPNGKLIQVKRQGTGPQTVTTVQSAPTQQSAPTRVIHNTVPPTVSPIAPIPAQQIVHSSGGHIIRAQLQSPRSITVQNPSILPQFQQQNSQQYQQITIRQPNQQIATIRYQGAGNQQVTNILQNGTVQLLNGAAVTAAAGQVATVRQVPTFVKQFFPNTPLGLSRNQLQNQIFSAMEICQHLMGKVQTLTNSNAYKTAKSLTDVKELYIHLSYLLTYAIGRFKGLQDNCLSDMRELGFTNDANSLENGQLAAGMDMVRKGQITDFANVDLDSFHSLIVQNMGRMITAAADSSTADGKIDVNKENYDTKLTERTHQEFSTEENEKSEPKNENSKTDNEFNDYESFPSPKVEIIEDDDDDCLLVEILGKNREADEDKSSMESDDELLVECGERKSDEEWNLETTQLHDSDDDDEEDFAVPGFSTSYENDDDYKATPNGGFTHDLDTKLIELVKGMPPLWDPDHQRINPNIQHQMWKKISRQMPSGLNCRMRWRNLRYRYMNYKKRLENSPNTDLIPPHRNAYLLKFLDSVRQRRSTSTARAQSSGSAQKATPQGARDDHAFIIKMIGVIEKYPSLWHPSSLALIRHTAQPEVWKNVHSELEGEGYKQASDAEEDEISIVEPKTDTINLDSDNEDESTKPLAKTNCPMAMQPSIKSHTNAVVNVNPVNPLANMNMDMNQMPLITPTTTTNAEDELTTEYDFSKVANLLAGMLEVELTEGGNGCVQLPKKPRKKTTNKPNPTLLKQKEIQERERLENMKKNDAKLKMQVQIPLNKVEEIYQYAKPLVEELKHEKEDNEVQVNKTAELLEPLEENGKKVEDREANVEEEKKTSTPDANEAVALLDNDIKDDDIKISKNTQIKTYGSKVDEKEDKEEPEEVVVVLLEDLDNSKEDEEAKHEAEDNDGSVEIIEHEDSQDSDRDLVQQENSVCSNDLNEKKNTANEKFEGDSKNKNVDETEENEIEEVAEMIENHDEEKVEEILPDVLINFDTNTVEQILPINETDIQKEECEIMDVDIDPLQDDNEKDLIVPVDIHNANKDVDNSLEIQSSHNIDFERILGRTEVV